MRMSYNKLWKLLIDKKMKWTIVNNLDTKRRKEKRLK